MDRRPGLPAKPDWSDPAADEHKYVTFAALKASLVHSASALSRRMAALQKAGLLETRKVHKIARDAKADRRSLALPITSAGVKRIEPVYELYAELCRNLLKDFPVSARQMIVETNERLIAEARWGV